MLCLLTFEFCGCAPLTAQSGTASPNKQQEDKSYRTPSFPAGPTPTRLVELLHKGQLLPDDGHGRPAQRAQQAWHVRREQRM